MTKFEILTRVGSKERYIRWGLDPHTLRSNFEGESKPAQDMRGHDRRSINSKRLSRGQHRRGADADWGVLDGSAYWRHLAQANAIERPRAVAMWPYYGRPME